MRVRHRVVGLLVASALLAAACSDDDAGPVATDAGTTAPSESTTPATDPPETTISVAPDELLVAGAASNSVLPTVDGDHAYLDEAPGWDISDPDDIGVFVPAFDQGSVDVGNGNGDAAWVHDDLRVTALALGRGDDIVVMVSSDVYMVFAADAAEIERRTRALLPADLNDTTQIIISATHNHHGPDTAFSINDDWYDLFADAAAEAAARAVSEMEPARLEVATGEHRFGQSDGRDPIIVDPTLNVMQVVADDGGDDRTIATVVQWASHPETTLGWDPPGDFAEECATKGWEPDDCSADGRYFTADYPGVLRERVQSALGGEVLYFNGAIGSQIGPGDADVWLVDEAHPVGDGVTAPAGAMPVAGAGDLRGENMARTEAIGAQLSLAVLALADAAEPIAVDEITWTQQPFYTRLTNIGFRVLLADGDLGWQDPTAYTCVTELTDETCVSDEGALEDDPVLTPLVESQIRTGDVLRTQLTWVTVGEVGFLFMPGEVAPELLIGLPDDFATNIAAYYLEPELHATGADYVIPGFYLSLVPTDITFTVGLGGDELGYWVPIAEARLKCLDLVIPVETGYTCQRLFDEGLLVTVDAVAGPICQSISRDGDLPPLTTEQLTALAAVCRYGQALGRELGEPDGHYEETNSAGWDLVDDTWAAAVRLFGG